MIWYYAECLYNLDDYRNVGKQNQIHKIQSTKPNLTNNFTKPNLPIKILKNYQSKPIKPNLA